MNTKVIYCSICGNDLTVDSKCESGKCFHCLLIMPPDPEGESEYGKDLAKDCAYFKVGNCSAHNDKQCLLINNQRCGHFESYVKEENKVSSRKCPICKENYVEPRKRYCKQCRKDRKADLKKWKSSSKPPKTPKTGGQITPPDPKF